jgi:hypothetical protein
MFKHDFLGQKVVPNQSVYQDYFIDANQLNRYPAGGDSSMLSKKILFNGMIKPQETFNGKRPPQRRQV